jgi:hypothetical protein
MLRFRGPAAQHQGAARPARQPDCAHSCRAHPQIFRRLHSLYVDTASNPFHAFGLPLASPKFDAAVEAIVAAYPKPGNLAGGFVM